MRILLFTTGKPSWSQVDAKILSELGSVLSVDVLELGGLAQFKVFQKIIRADLCYFWFGSFRYLPFLVFAYMARKKIVVVAGGYDVNGLDSIGYGVSADNLMRRWLRLLVFKIADQVLAVSEFTFKSAVALGLPPRKLKTVPLAVQPFELPRMPWKERKNRVLFLLSAYDDGFLVKGVDRIPEICRSLPNVQFQLAGSLGERAKKYLNESKVKNLELLGHIPYLDPRFVQLLNESRVVCLPSRLESFGAALIDGALQGCVPIAFAVGAIPETLREIGYLVKEETPQAMALVIEEAVSKSTVDVEQLRQKAQGQFAYEKRSRILKTLLQDLCD